MKEMSNKIKTETLGRAQAVIRVKPIDHIWIGGCCITDDLDKLRVKVICRRGRGVCGQTREQTILNTIHYGVDMMRYLPGKGITFESAKKILREIEDSVQPRLF